jgi:hypothetical protein
VDNLPGWLVLFDEFPELLKVSKIRFRADRRLAVPFVRDCFKKLYMVSANDTRHL